MSVLDINCFAGHWPFRRIRKNTFSDLVSIHKENSISHGLVSSINAIFYNDPFEGDTEIYKELKDTSYKQAMTINPLLVHAVRDVERGVSRLSAAAVRIYPGYHGYLSDCSELISVCEAVHYHKLPLVYTARLEDERLEYMFRSAPFDANTAAELALRFPEMPIIFTCVRSEEVLLIWERTKNDANVFFDTSGLKNNLFAIDKLLETVPSERILFGSQYPLFCLSSTLLKIVKADCTDYQRQNMLFNNAVKLIY